MLKQRLLKIFGVVLFFIVLLTLPSVAQLAVAENISSDQVGIYFVWVMFPSWIYLGGAIIMLSLGFKYMAGGALSKPFILMGFALLLDALVNLMSSLVIIGLIPSLIAIDQVVFAVGLLFRLSVVFGMVWIGNIFGVLRRTPKPAPVPASSPNPPAGA